ncbi:MAG: glycosyltransferase family 4 protein [Planctomycetes bacterium]|nr:glycosyltransferase family 4 protein [Planctomycetota bacterium]
MQLLVLKRGTFSGITASLLDAWKTGSPQDRLQLCDLDDGFLESPIAKLKALPELVKAGASQGVGKAARNYRQIVSRSRSNLVRLEQSVRDVLSGHSFDAALIMQTMIPMPHSSKPTFIYTDHTILANRYYPDGDAAIERWHAWLDAERETIQHAAIIFTMSRHVSDSLTEFYDVPKERVRCVGAGFNARQAQRIDGQERRAKNIIFVGLDWERKGGPQMVEAFARVRESHPDATLTIVGCEPNVSCRGVEVLGVVPIERVSELMAEACCFCMPSLREPFGLVYLEAMHAGLPVIALDLGAPRDFVSDGDTGFLVPPGDIAAMALAMEKLVANPERCAKMGAAARGRVSQEYTWAKTQSQMSQAIEEVVRDWPS